MLRIQQDALTFDDLLLLPRYSEVLPREVNLTTHLTKNIKLNVPIVSAAMDTVTESRLAISMAQEGGLGIIHKSMSIEQQAKQVKTVKKHENGIVRNPITIEKEAPISALFELVSEHGISGVPVMDQGKLSGIVTSRDMRFIQDIQATVGSIMTTKEHLVTAPVNSNQSVLVELFNKHRIEKVLLVDQSFNLCGMVTVKDLKRLQEYPHSCKDDLGRLRVGAAVGTGADTKDRVAALYEAGVDVVIVDTAHGHSKGVIDSVKWIKKYYPDLPVIGGNIATAQAAQALADAGADGVKVGIGPGSICTTRIVTGVGVPQLTAVSNVVEALNGTDVSVIADGGIRYSGDLAKVIVAGAHVVMLGSVLAGTEEAPGEVELYQGKSYKAYRGMGSLGAMGHDQGSSDRYFQHGEKRIEKLVPEGIEGRVSYKGLLHDVLHQMLGGLRSAMGYTGSKDIQTMRTEPEFVRVTSAGMSESHVHDVSITKEAPNYRAS